MDITLYPSLEIPPIFKGIMLVRAANIPAALINISIVEIKTGIPSIKTTSSIPSPATIKFIIPPP